MCHHVMQLSRCHLRCHQVSQLPWHTADNVPATGPLLSSAQGIHMPYCILGGGGALPREHQQ